MTPEERKRFLDLAFDLTNESNAARIYEALARAHAEGLEAAARLAGQIYSVADIGLDDGPSVVGDKLALAIHSLIPAAPEVRAPLAYGHDDLACARPEAHLPHFRSGRTGPYCLATGEPPRPCECFHATGAEVKDE